MRKKFPSSIRKYIRKEKARIRREVLSLKEQEKQIQELYKKFAKKNQDKKIEKKVIPSPAALCAAGEGGK